VGSVSCEQDVPEGHAERAREFQQFMREPIATEPAGDTVMPIRRIVYEAIKQGGCM
jgi:hypothetical protein